MSKVRFVKVNKEFPLEVLLYKGLAIDTERSKEVQWEMNDGGEITKLEKGACIKHKFYQTYAGKKVYFTAYLPSQSPWKALHINQIITCYIEEENETNVRVESVKYERIK